MIYYDLGLLGAGFAVSIANCFFYFFTLGALFVYDEIREALKWPEWNDELWGYLKQFTALAIPSMLMAFLEMAGVECLQVLAGLISSKSSDAEAIVMNLYAGFYSVYIAMAISTGIFVGQAIGSGKVHKARRYANAS